MGNGHDTVWSHRYGYDLNTLKLGDGRDTIAIASLEGGSAVRSTAIPVPTTVPTASNLASVYRPEATLAEVTRCLGASVLADSRQW